MRKDQRRLSRRSLDRRLRSIDPNTLSRPPAGWVRAVRDALGLTTRQLANRLDITPVAITRLEESERLDTAQLGTLRRAADALNCDLVYAFVPRTSLDDTVRQQALAVARSELARIDHSMRLEDQALSNEVLAERISDYAEQLVDDRTLWDRRL